MSFLFWQAPRIMTVGVLGRLGDCVLALVDRENNIGIASVQA